MRVELPYFDSCPNFVGSRTILVDGADPFASGGEQVGLACRLYPTSTGRGGAPETAQLVEVLS